jgi:hypothetical protein
MGIDESGYSIKVPPYLPESEEDKLLEEVVEEAKHFAKALDKDFEKKLAWK